MLISQAEMDAICNRKIRRRWICSTESPKIGSLRVLTTGKTPPIKVTILDVQPSTIESGQWLIKFARGDTRAFLLQDVPVFLSKDGGYTTRQSRQAVPGDPELAKCPGAAENARITALARRQAPVTDTIRRLKGEAELLRDAMTTMKARNHVKQALWHLEKANGELPVAEIA